MTTTNTDSALRYLTNEAAGLRDSASENMQWAAEAEADGRHDAARDYREWAANAEREAARHEATLSKMADEGAIWF